MKKVILISMLTLAMAANSQAEEHNTLGGLIIGAGGGALAGQVIGRNTQSTVIGTAVGSVIGFIIGSEMDKNERYTQRVNHRQRGPIIHKQKQIVSHNYYYEPISRNPKVRKRCKKAEILGTVHGKARKIYGTVCKTPRGWELVSQEPYQYEYSRYGNTRHQYDYDIARHYPSKPWKKHRRPRDRF